MWMMNWKEIGTKQSWLNFKDYPGISFEGLRKNTKYLISGEPVAGAKNQSRHHPNTRQEC
jgi:hypothetical protein